MNKPFTRIAAGQILLIICCIFYLIWWSISYKPNESVNRLSGINGILLLITAVCGLSGVTLSIYGLNHLPVIRPLLNGLQIVGGGIAAYIILLCITRFCFNRPVTTELVLIVGWVMLEMAVCNSLYSAEVIDKTRTAIILIIIAIAFLISMILYVLYYKMEPMRAYYAAMVPLITEAAAMTALLVVI